MSPRLKLVQDSYMDNVSITQRHDGVVNWVLIARKAVFEGDDKVKLAEMKITFPEKELVLTADGGTYDVDQRNLEIEGNINASTRNYNIVATRLFWNASGNELISDDKVKIIGKRFSVEGDTLEASSGKAKLSKNVKAIFSGQ